MSEFAFFQAQVRAEWQDWTFGAHQAAARAAAAEELTALRRQFTELSEPELLHLADSWRSDSASGPYFVFIAADADFGAEADSERRDDTATEPAQVATDARFVSSLFHELGDQAPAALAALFDRWSEQRRHAAYAGLRTTPVPAPRVALLLPRDGSWWPSDSWHALVALDLDAPRFDGTLLRWDSDSGSWQAERRG